MESTQPQPTLQDIVHLITTMKQELKHDIHVSADSLRSELNGSIRDSADSLRSELNGSIRDSAEGLRTEMAIHFREVNEKIDSLEEKTDQRHHEVMSHIDGFIAMHNRVDTETVSLRSAYRRINEQLQAIISQSYPQLA